MSQTAAKATDKPQESVKETIISVVISFAMAFVFRSYVVEPFRIPTGSMAPTLLGAHMRFQSPTGGYDWTVNPRDPGGNAAPWPVQGSAKLDRDPILVQDPMTGAAIQRAEVPLRAGDRILVLKYLYLLREPKRYEVVVFKDPSEPKQNLIKRLVGLPGEDVLIVDGDIFTRPAGTQEPYRVTRKPDRTQREVWAPLFTTDHAPPDGAFPEWRGPWTASGGDEDWDLATREYRWTGAEPGTLRWDSTWRPINDSAPYNATLNRAVTGPPFPISDLRLRARVNPDSDGAQAAFAIDARKHTFSATITADSATMTAISDTGETLLTETISRDILRAGSFTDVEFWHADQRLSLWIDGEKILESEYDWTSSERFASVAAPGRERIEPADPNTIAAPEVSMTFSGSPVTLTGVALDRDLYYRPMRRNGRYFRASHPTYPATMSSDEFFMLGDNSAASHDGRGWRDIDIDPWIGDRFGYKAGVVPRELILGKAFMVYWPAPYKARAAGLRLPVPDAGRVRFIR